MNEVPPPQTENHSATAVVASILASARVVAEIGRVAAELTLEQTSAVERTRGCLNEVVALQKPWMVKFYQWALRPLHAGTPRMCAPTRPVSTTCSG